MHILFAHRNFPAQFGHIARRLASEGYRCTFISEKPEGEDHGIRRLQFVQKHGATERTHYCSRTFENQMAAAAAILERLHRENLQPDLVVGHSGLISTLFLRELYDCPIINYFEYFYRIENSDFSFRADLPRAPMRDRARARARNASLLLDLDNCDAGYSPTEWQRSRFPKEYLPKLSAIFDGIETDVWRPGLPTNDLIAGLALPPEVKVVTYVSRGMESMRGFDIFMRVAQRLCDERSDVVVLVIGEDRIAYGGDKRFTGEKSFKQWVLERGEYDLERIKFVGRVPAPTLARIFNRSDLHIYLTVPFVLSWSLMNALACGTTILASDTPPVKEMISHGQNGLLCDFFDVDKLVRQAHEVLNAPAAFRHLGAAGTELIREKYSIEVCLPQLSDLFTRIAG